MGSWATNASRSRFRWRYLNSHLQNALKVIIGFKPAFLTFALTKDWWLLVYFGAFIWFGITGLRNIVQSRTQWPASLKGWLTVIKTSRPG